MWWNTNLWQTRIETSSIMPMFRCANIWRRTKQTHFSRRSLTQRDKSPRRCWNVALEPGNSKLPTWPSSTPLFSRYGHPANTEQRSGTLMRSTAMSLIWPLRSLSGATSCDKSCPSWSWNKIERRLTIHSMFLSQQPPDFATWSVCINRLPQMSSAWNVTMPKEHRHTPQNGFSSTKFAVSRVCEEHLLGQLCHDDVPWRCLSLKLNLCLKHWANNFECFVAFGDLS